MQQTNQKSRATKQRDAILKVFHDADRPLKPEEVWNLAMKKVARMGLTTVYRAIKACVEQGILTSVSVPGEPPRYELSGKKHHHHFLCRACDGMYEVNRCIGKIESSAPPGFLVEDHHITLYGVCKECRTSP